MYIATYNDYLLIKNQGTKVFPHPKELKDNPITRLFLSFEQVMLCQPLIPKTCTPCSTIDWAPELSKPEAKPS